MKKDREHFFTGFFKDFYGVGWVTQPVSDEVAMPPGFALTESTVGLSPRSTRSDRRRLVAAMTRTSTRISSRPRARSSSAPGCPSALP